MIYNIAIDGPAGAGKSTIARRVAKELSFIYVDTGAMYRAMALYLLHKNVDRTNKEQIGEVCQNAEISIEYQNGEQIVLLNGENVNAYLRTEEVGNMASVSSAVPRVREKLLSLQRKLAKDMSVVMDGRDIGTTILPDADVKIYLTASSLTRAKRRYLELQEKEKEQDRNLMNLPVLVVDDDRTCCESTVATLKEIGIMGEWVLSGREAVECCYARHELKDDYFAVILDWKMPDMDGIETARQIRKRIGKEITIIVLTSYEFSEIEEEAKAAGIDAFIAKPLFRSRLTATLRQFTSGRKEKTARNYLEKLSESDYTGKRILLVEDNELNREIAGEILQMTGAKVETAENGKIAVEKVEASPKGSYDLIFMDIQMPVMNGYEATAAIRSLPGAKGKLPIVAMTANAFAEDVQLAKNTGMNGHIAKPLDMNKLNDVLKNWL